MEQRVRVEVAALTDRGLRRERNEDAFLVFRTGRFLERLDSNIGEGELGSRLEPRGYILAVADGMGGAAAGEIASREALVEAFHLILRSPEWLLGFDDPATREMKIREFFERTERYVRGMHEALARHASADPSVAGMGTTLTVAYSVGLDLFVVHLGDSRAYLYRGGVLRHMTRDHTVAQRDADAGLIPQQDVAVHPSRHILTRVVGGRGGPTPRDAHHVVLEVGDTVLVCTDGLTGPVPDAEIAGVLDRARSCKAACRSLVDLSLARGAPDNVTVIVARYHGEPA